MLGVVHAVRHPRLIIMSATSSSHSQRICEKMFRVPWSEIHKRYPTALDVSKVPSAEHNFTGKFYNDADMMFELIQGTIQHECQKRVVFLFAEFEDDPNIDILRLFVQDSLNEKWIDISDKLGAMTLRAQTDTTNSGVILVRQNYIRGFDVKLKQTAKAITICNNAVNG